MVAPKKLASPPAEWEALHKASASRLLKAEATSTVAMRTEARSVHHELLGRLQSTGTRTGALNALKAARTQMADTVAASIADVRARAREAALVQVNAELNRLAIELAKLGYDGKSYFGVPVKTDKEADHASADAVGHSLAASWAQAVLAYLVNAQDDESIDVEVRARTVMQRLDKNLKRIAATESAKAYNDQHDDGMDEALEPEEGEAKPRWLLGVFKWWSAILDMKVCPDCRGHHGDITLLGFDFPNGDEPGYMHPYCRCTSTTIFLPIYAGKGDEEPDLDDVDDVDDVDEDAEGEAA